VAPDDVVPPAWVCRSQKIGLMDKGGAGTESTMSCPLLKALEAKGLRSPNGISEKSVGPSVLRASCRADMTTVLWTWRGWNDVLY
jgi:hypothetical protein